MNKIIFLFILLTPVFAFSQFNRPVVDSIPKDSIEYYEKQLSEIKKKYDEGARNESIEIHNRLRLLKREADTYNGFILYSQAVQVNYEKLNKDLEANGFPTLSGQLWSVGYGFTFKEKRRVFDFYIGAFGIPKRSEKDGETVKLDFGTYLDFIWGYDFVKSNRVNIYPYLGFGFRAITLQFKSAPQINSSPIGVTDIITNNRSFRETVNEFGYQAGLGLEFVITGRDRDGGTLLFINAGTNRPFKSKSFDIEGYKYQPSLKAGNLTAKAGFKFFFR